MSEPNLRHAVRALVVDPDDRLLLARYELPHIALWATPGGGREPGEGLRDTLARELREEIGLALPDRPLPHVWHRTVVSPLAVEGFDGIVEDYFLLRTDHFEPRGELTDEQLRAENLLELRWWGLPEIRVAEAERVKWSPRHLLDLYEALLRDGPPAEPLPLAL
mgnify:CR=1 FL=1